MVLFALAGREQKELSSQGRADELTAPGKCFAPPDYRIAPTGTLPLFVTEMELGD